MSFVDLNRSGVALMEIVSKPDLRSADEAKAYVSKLRTILRYLGTCDGDMEKGSLRADVNVSVRKPGGALGTRCEIKNVNSIRFIGQAIEHEARRQISILEDGGKIEQETRLFDPDKGETRSMRNKEEAHDYRYFPDPDLLPLELDADLRRGAQGAVCRSCRTKRRRASSRDYGLSAYDAGVLVGERETADFFEAVAKAATAPRRQGGGQLGHQRACRPPQQGRQGHRGLARSRPATRRHPRSDRRRHDFRQDCQGLIRDHLDRRWRPAGDRRGARDDAGDRPLRDREARRRHHRRQSREGGASEGEARADRLVRRPGDESVGRQGQPAGGERAAQDEAGRRRTGTHDDETS